GNIRFRTTDLAEVKQRGVQPGHAAETEQGDVREPRSLLAPVHPEPLEAGEDVESEAPGVTAHVVEDEHADAAGLAVAAQIEPDRACGGSGGAQLTPDRLGLFGGTAAEERDRGVEIVARH